MPNWCSTAYVIEGDAQEIKSLYELMKDLQDRKTPAVKNGFGTSWLGCLVDALGKDWDKVSCRGDWANLEMVGETLRMSHVLYLIHPNLPVNEQSLHPGL